MLERNPVKNLDRNAELPKNPSQASLSIWIVRLFFPVYEGFQLLQSLQDAVGLRQQFCERLQPVRKKGSVPNGTKLTVFWDESRSRSFDVAKDPLHAEVWS